MVTIAVYDNEKVFYRSVIEQLISEGDSGPKYKRISSYIYCNFQQADCDTYSMINEIYSKIMCGAIKIPGIDIGNADIIINKENLSISCSMSGDSCTTSKILIRTRIQQFVISDDIRYIKYMNFTISKKEDFYIITDRRRCVVAEIFNHACEINSISDLVDKVSDIVDNLTSDYIPGDSINIPLNR